MKTADDETRDPRHADDNTGSFVSTLVKNTDAALAAGEPDGGTLEETLARAVAATRGKPTPPPAIVFRGHTQSLAGEFFAKSQTIKSQADDLLDKIRAREAVRDAAIERIHNEANIELNQLEAEHADLVRGYDALATAHETLSK